MLFLEGGDYSRRVSLGRKTLFSRFPQPVIKEAPRRGKTISLGGGQRQDDGIVAWRISKRGRANRTSIPPSWHLSVFNHTIFGRDVALDDAHFRCREKRVAALGELAGHHVSTIRQRMIRRRGL